MTTFSRLARPVILAASRSDKLRRNAERLPVTGAVVRRFVAGETVENAVAAVAQLRVSDRMISVDYLGEQVTDPDAADATVAAYMRLLDMLAGREEAAQTPVRPLEVSLKLSALGQALPKDGEKIAYENAHAICERAQAIGAWVTVDAEDHTTTDSTLSIVRDLRTDFDWLGTVLQAYLKRTEGDCRDFAGSGPAGSGAGVSGARIRLCKGAYDEPASVAYRDRAEVTDSYLRCLRILMTGDGYPMVASHDPAIIDAVPGLAGESGRGTDEFEYQMLFGIRDDEQRRLSRDGNNVRVYVPFGINWYGYLVRRLAERPANLTFFLRALAGSASPLR